MERKMLKDAVPGTRLAVFVNQISRLEYNDRGQIFFHVFVTDGEEMADIPLKDARIHMAKGKFENKVVYITVAADDEGNQYIAKIENCNDIAPETFGKMTESVPDFKDNHRTKLADSKRFVDRNFTAAVLVTGVTEKKSKNGDPYCSITVTDGETSSSFNWWNTSADEVKEKYQDKVIYLTVKMEQYPKVVGAEPCEDYPVSTFIKTVPVDSETMYDEITSILQEMSQRSTMAPVVLHIFEENKDKILRWAAALKFHHSVYGGLLYHVYRMMKAAHALADVYPGLKRDLLVLGVIVHDIGKLRELDTNELGVTEFESDGNLEGHILLGIEMLTEAVCSMPEDQKPNLEEFRLLKHMIASHHGKKEWGAVVVPAIPEAMVLHNLDMIDSRMYMFEEAEQKLDEGETSDPVFTLDGAHVYKPVPFEQTGQH